MTSPTPGHNPEPPDRRSRLSLTQRISIAVGLVILTALAGGAWWAWVWIHEQLVPLVESNLNQLLGRPIELGEVEQVGFDSIRFGASAIPATPTDVDRITTEGVIVEFALLPLLVPGDAIARLYDVSPAIAIGDVAATARVVGTTSNLQTIVQFQLPEDTYPGQGELVIASGGNILLRDAVFNVAGGVVEATGQLAEGQFQATIEAARVRLNQFSQDLRGQLKSQHLRDAG